MAFLDYIVIALGGCAGLLEVLTLLFDAAAVYVGVKTLQRHKRVAAKLAQVHGRAAIKKPTWWPVVILGVCALIFTVLTAWKYLHGVSV